MKRYTYRDKDNPKYVGTIDHSNGTKSVNSQCIERLCELEDKIESGLLLELPCKLGETIYFIWSLWNVGPKRNTIYQVREKKFVLDDLQYLGVWCFSTKEAAEARLAELKGERP